MFIFEDTKSKRAWPKHRKTTVEQYKMKCYAVLSILLSMVAPSSASYSPSAPESSNAYDKQPAAADAKGAVKVSAPTAPPKKRDSANAVMNLRNRTVSIAPSEAPSAAPSAAPSWAPSAAPSGTPTAAPSAAPSRSPSALPTLHPTSAPSCNNTRKRKGQGLEKRIAQCGSQCRSRRSHLRYTRQRYRHYVGPNGCPHVQQDSRQKGQDEKAQKGQ
jgi:hypothetical protein